MAAFASVPEGYVWEDPGDSIMIQVSLDLVERMGAVVQQLLGGASRGNEIGGVLLGRTLPGSGRAILIDDFELKPCEHLRGASYTLSPRDRRLLGARLTRRDSRQVVGYFRSHTRPGMYLDQDDFAVFSQYFPEPWQVFLLVRPSMEGPPVGGFFFWEDGDVNRRAPYRQFPFDHARLAEGGFPITGGQALATAGPRPAPVLVPQPEMRARRTLPPLPWVVVPLIAFLFLVGAFVVSENQTPSSGITVVKASPPIEPLLPEPVPQAAVSTPAVSSQAALRAPEPVAETKTVAASKPKPARQPRPIAATPPPVAVARTMYREVEPPPALGAPNARLDPKLATVLPSRVAAAPPLEADVSYEAPHPGVFRRALHKIEGVGEPESGAFVAPSPIRKVAPMKPAGADADGRQVDVKVFIDQSGGVSRAQVLTKGADLSAAALSAARQWQFTPARKHDKPVPSEMVLHFRF
ncbi:MAG: TonB family protein [Bryobacteraceae bacterium]|jgi:TonB family protein